MCRQVVVGLPSRPASARVARRFVAEHCTEWGLAELCDDLVLPVSELVTNAVVHARTPITVTVSLTGQFVEVSVRDTNPRPPVSRPVRLDLDADILAVADRLTELPEDLRDPALHVGDAGSIAAGRGLHIVDAAADEWGVSELTGGKDVWFRIATAAAADASDCRCSTEHQLTTAGGLALHIR